jgi:hypothetical protein
MYDHEGLRRVTGLVLAANNAHIVRRHAGAPPAEPGAWTMTR